MPAHRAQGQPRPRRRWTGLLAATLAVTPALITVSSATPAEAATVTSATFTGGAGTVTVDGMLYAKQGSALTLTLATSPDTRCIVVAGAITAHQSSSTGRSTWTVAVTAPAADGLRAVTAAASDVPDATCTGAATTAQAAYTVDSTGPVITGAVTPAVNSSGWSTGDVRVDWTATDAGSGVVGDQPFRTESVTTDGIVTLRTPAQKDRLGNTGAPGSYTVRLDSTAPTITATQTRNANGSTTITFTCADATSGIYTCVVDGTTVNSKQVQPGVTVTGTATDKAGHKATASSTAPVGDTTPPTLTGAPTTQPNAAGWYRGDVTVAWTASDPESGIPAAPASTTITGEGTGLTSSQTVKNGAGLLTTASSPAVRIDRTAPATGISGTSNAWVAGSVTLTLKPTDNLSTVASTSYTVDGGAPRNGTSVLLTTDGDHTITYASTDAAGNTEATQTAHVRIDRTAPTIGHAFTPAAYVDGAWTNRDVTVTFACADQGGSGLAGCSGPTTVSAEGQHTVTGTATDGAGNTATDDAGVRIDRTAPVVTATAVGTRNAAGWYRDDVVVTFSATDAGGSGLTASPAAQTLREGRGQGASATVTDGAGNTATAGVTGIDVDTTPPVLTGTAPSGWQTGDVTVTWTCTDALSGVVGQPAAATVTGEGADLSATAGCTDVAGNTVTTTVHGIMIDRTAPTTRATVADADDAGWYGGDVQVTLEGSDNLSGATVSYTLDGGPTRTYDAPFTVGEGTHSITSWSVDGAGNVEAPGAPLTLRVDPTAPRTTVVNPISTGSGWYVTSGIPVAFRATDSGSGVAATYYRIDTGAAQTYGEPFTADLSDGVHTITYWSVDVAGNEEAHATTNTLAVAVDTIEPTITGSQTPAANAATWNNTDVDVTFSCADEGSGVPTAAGCAGATTLTDDGAGQTVQGDAVDVAGNRSSVTYGPVNIDKTRPTLRGVPADPNGAGWYTGDVPVTWVGDDALSGVDEGTQPGTTTVTGEGSDLGAGPVTVTDVAGNTSDPASVGGIRIDRRAPVVSGRTLSAPNAAGWYRDPVTVDFTCADPVLADGTDGSGVASCPTSKQVEGDGAGQGVTSDPASDVAGNVGVGTTVGGIDIDGTAPSTTADNRCTATNGWCTGSTADVLLTATDQAGLSGVQEIHYAVDGGAEQVAAGASTTVSVPLTGSGAGAVRYWAVDRAGNVEQPNGVSLRWDTIAPTVTHRLSPAPNADDWNNGDVTVTFSAADDDKGSGVAGVTAPVTVSTETAGRLVTGTARDTAGNVGTDEVTVRLDTTRPTITGAVTSGVRGGAGWYTGPVTVHFTCADALSGIADTMCPSDVVVTANGPDQSVTRTVRDRAGNAASATVSGLSIDREAPTLTTKDVNVEGGTFTLGAVPAATCTAADSFSGVASCTVTVSGGNANGVGPFGYTATAVDRAGNRTVVTGSYRVIYRFDGFLQPVNDTAHQVGTSTSVFKAGSTVPLKFQLKRADGTVVQGVSATWLTPAKGSATNAPVDESVYTATADSGTAYRYDAGAQQYVYNWKTGTGGSYWRIGVTLDDGRTYSVSVGLR